MIENENRTDVLLKEIEKHTGLRLLIAQDQEADEERVASVLEGFLEPYKKGLGLNEFWLSFLKDQIPNEELEIHMKSFQLREATTAVVFLLRFPMGTNAHVQAIIQDLKGDDARIIAADEEHYILLKQLSGPVSKEKLREEANVLVDTISAELMIPVYVSYDECVDSLLKLPESFKRVEFAEKCGRWFSPSERVYSYHDLGLGKLIGKLSMEDCREYLSDHLGSFRFDAMDAELSTTIHTFFEEGLSIANTARRLYVHRNTLVYRLDKFEKLSGLDLRRFEDAITARIAMLMEVYLMPGEE